MGNRIDREGAVPEHHSRNKGAPNEALQTPEDEEKRSRHICGHQLHTRPVQPTQLRITRKIINGHKIRQFPTPGQEPAYVGPPETVDSWRMQILRPIRMPVMLAVVCCPPERIFLR